MSNQPERIDEKRRQLLAAMGALALGADLRPLRAEESVSLRFLCPQGALVQSVLDSFTKAGAKIDVEVYADAPAIYPKVAAKDAPYDVIVAPERVVARMIFANLLQNIDGKLVPNLKNLDPAFTNAAFDPGRRYSVAYAWGTVGVGYRRSVLGVEPGSWKWIFDSDRYAGRIGWLSDPELTLGCALKYQGHSVNTLQLSELDAAAALLKQQRPRVTHLAATEAGELLLARDVDLVLARNGEISRARARDPDIDYVIPGEGSLLLQYCLCIPRRATHAREAHAFIDYLLRPEVAAEVARTLRFATPIAAARAALPEAERNDPVTYPDDQIIARSEIMNYRGERVISRFEQAWQSINAKT
jgi:spermidine/putrescine transport system substrate-binding protein